MADNNDTRTDEFRRRVEERYRQDEELPLVGGTSQAVLDAAAAVYAELTAAPSRPPVAGTVIHAPHQADTLKMIRETFCLAQFALNHWLASEEERKRHSERIGRLIDDIDRQRPLGPDGKHGTRHTPTCGCEDKA